MTRPGVSGWPAEAALVGVAAIEAALSANLAPAVLTVTVLAVLVLTVRRRWPIPVFLVTLPALFLSGAMVATLIALYSVSTRYRNLWILAGCWLVAGVGYTYPAFDLDFSDGRSELMLTLIYAGMTTLAPILLGRLTHTQRALAVSLEDSKQAREHERQLDAQAILAKERNQLAREMHDVVSHQVSLLAVQASALRVSTADPDAKDAAENMRRLSVDTLDELRHMVNLLRASGTPATELTPQPTLTDLERLVGSSGIEARLIGSAPAGIEPAVQRTIYRTIQEALTNVRKHAPGSTATIEIAQDDTDLTVTVTNTPPTRPTLALPSARHGLVGLRERAALLGGTIKAEPTPEGGFRLRMRLPVAHVGLRSV